MDNVLDLHSVPSDVRECKFYYECVMSAWKWLYSRENLMAIVGEFKFLRFMMSEGGTQVCF